MPLTLKRAMTEPIPKLSQSKPKYNFKDITEYTIIAPYKYQEDMAKEIESKLKEKGKIAKLLTKEDIDFQDFKSGDPNIKVNYEKVNDKNIIFILNLEKNETIFPQLSLINWLRCFVIPNQEQSLIDLDENGLKAWKATILRDEYTLGQARSLTIVIPWYRHCQSERTSRFSLVNGKYTNLINPEGEFLDIPTAQTFAALLSSQANLPPTTRDSIIEKIRESKINIENFPQRVLLIDIHDDLAEMFYPPENPNPRPVIEHVLDNFNCWHNDPSKVYDMTTGNGKYFCSVLNHFLKSKQLPSKTFDTVLFPDKGAFLRFKQIVISNGITDIYYIVKYREGETSKSGPYIYMSNDKELSPDKKLESRHILIIDDFTNSGSTLFDAKEILDNYIKPETNVSCWISHFVGNYATSIDNKLIAQIRMNFTKFYCSDSLPEMTKKLNDVNRIDLDIKTIIDEFIGKYTKTIIDEFIEKYTKNEIYNENITELIKSYADKLSTNKEKITTAKNNIEVVSCASAIVDWITADTKPTSEGGSIKKYKKYRKRTRKQKNHKN